MNQLTWDAFISYASEDRDSVAIPIKTGLEAFGFRMWIDQSELKIGDSLRESIDNGLAQSRFGIIILSHNFFAKHYPQRELNGLASREVDGSKILLPVWHDLSASEVRAYSPPLADRIAAKTSDGIENISKRLAEVLRTARSPTISSEPATRNMLAVDIRAKASRLIQGSKSGMMGDRRDTSTMVKMLVLQVDDYCARFANGDPFITGAAAEIARLVGELSSATGIFCLHGPPGSDHLEKEKARYADIGSAASSLLLSVYPFYLGE
jgi:hypothetical protein